MEQLLQKSTIDLNKLKRYINTSAARELSALSSPCYYSKTKKFYFELLNILRLKDSDIKDFVKRIYKGTKAEKWVLWRDPATNLLVFIMHLFLEKKDRVGFQTTLLYYMIIQYSRLMNKQIKYCDEEAFKYALDTLTRTHLFFREKSISNALYYLSTQVGKTYEKDIMEWNIDKIILFIGVARHRISQSVKSFAQHYYNAKKNKLGIKSQSDQEDEEGHLQQYKVLERGQKIIEDVVKTLVVYKTIDRKAFDEAKRISKIKTSIATMIADKVTSDKNMNDIKVLLQVFLKGVTDVSMICGDNYYPYVKKLMGVKRTTDRVYFKSQINVLLIKIVNEMNFANEYNKYTQQTKFIINTFLAYYITLVLRNRLC
jgi:hypothetical protein